MSDIFMHLIFLKLVLRAFSDILMCFMVEVVNSDRFIKHGMYVLVISCYNCCDEFPFRFFLLHPLRVSSLNVFPRHCPSQVQVDTGQQRDHFTELPVSLVLFCLICVDIIERIRPCKLTGKGKASKVLASLRVVERVLAQCLKCFQFSYCVSGRTIWHW